MQPRVTVQPAPQGRPGWIVAYENDPTPISEHATREEAEIAAREHAREFGQPEIIIYSANGDREYQQFEPEHWKAPTVKDVKAGPAPG
ncbi:MAG: hypothetical protein QOH46_104 [Solirubrobacteraceae bacterium]|jgi:hypothetical protein|nr:hypothetical protein [Solirubrobacteraceae bacterium]